MSNSKEVLLSDKTDGWKINYSTNKSYSVFKTSLSLEWMIKEETIQAIPSKYPEILSPLFNFLSSKWYLSFHPNGIELEQEGKVMLYLFTKNPGSGVQVKIKACLKDINGDDHRKSDFSEVFSTKYKGWGGCLIYRSDLEKKRRQLFYDDDFNIYCEISGGKKVVKDLINERLGGIDQPTTIEEKGAGFLQNELEALLREQKNCDISVQVGHNTFQAHKCILAARSSVFAAMFQHDMKENRSNVITITDIEAAVMSGVLEYIYSGKVKDNSVDKALDLYVAADKYALKDLKTQCTDLLLENVSVDNVFDIAVLADAHNDGKIIDSIKCFVGENSSFLSPETLKSLVKRFPDLASDIILDLSLKLSGKFYDSVRF